MSAPLEELVEPPPPGPTEVVVSWIHHLSPDAILDATKSYDHGWHTEAAKNGYKHGCPGAHAAGVAAFRKALLRFLGRGTEAPE